MVCLSRRSAAFVISGLRVFLNPEAFSPKKNFTVSLVFMAESGTLNEKKEEKKREGVSKCLENLKSRKGKASYLSRSTNESVSATMP